MMKTANRTIGDGSMIMLPTGAETKVKLEQPPEMP